MEPAEPNTATPEKSTKRRAKRADNKIDTWFKGSRVDKYFKVTERGSNFTTEFIAGCTTFLTACYIMAVNPNILSVTGLNYEGLVFATAMSSCVATLIMGLWANLPFGLWPGMGMNAYFAYTIVGFKGTLTPVKKVMFAVLIEGVVFMVMSALDVRRYIMKTFPRWLMSATMAGIGLFLAQIGLHAGNGIDLVRDHPAIYVDAFNTNIDYSARTWLGIFMFFLMAALVTLRVKGAVMIAILASTFLCWTLEAAGEKQFVYQPQCCLGSITYTSATSWYPRPGSSWIGPKEFLSQPVCGGGPEGVFEVPGSASNVEIEGNPGFFASSWSGAKVTGSFYNWTVTEADGTEHYVPGKALSYQGNGDGRNGLGNKGDCNDVCHQMFGGFGGVVPGEYGYGPCWGTIMTDTSCWTSMTPSNDNQANEHQQAAGAINLDQSLASITVIDGFGAGCTGGAGREPRTFEAPSKVAEAPYAKLAGAIVSAWPGWFGCSATNSSAELPGGLCTADGEEAGDCSCFAGNVDGGTVWAFDTSDLDMQNFGIPLLVLLYVDFLGTMGFLYAAADCSGLIDPTTGT